MTTKTTDYIEGQDTDEKFVNQTTGEPVGEPGTHILTFGGPFVNPIVKQAEDPGTPEADRAPVKFQDMDGVLRARYPRCQCVRAGLLTCPSRETDYIVVAKGA